MSAELWCYPVLPLSEYVIWAGCGFLDEGYYKATISAKTGLGSVHPGADWNGLGGGNTDLGKPVRAIGSGRVTHAAIHRVWGWVVSILHGNGIESQYAHFNECNVKEGDLVRVGQQIGTIGRGGKNSKGEYYYFAHLHIEVRFKRVPPDEWPSATMSKKAAEAYIASTRYNPATFLASVNAAKSLEELKAKQDEAVALAAATSASATTLTPVVQKYPSNWVRVKDPATMQAVNPALWVSIMQRQDGGLEAYQVPAYKLSQQGVSA